MSEFTELMKAISSVAWPAILGIILWKLFPDLKGIVASKNFSIKIAGMEVSAQDVTEQIRTQLDDLQKQVISLRSSQQGGVEDINANNNPGSPQPEPVIPARRILWVDDKPQNNVLEIAQLQDRGFEVVQTVSTQDAMQMLRSEFGFAAVISDMGRREAGSYIAQAGTLLLAGMRRAGDNTPFFVYSSQRYVARNRAEVVEAGGDGATASPIELLEWIERVTRKGPD